MAFSSVRENVTPPPSWNCVENIIVYYILLMIFNFKLNFIFIIITDVIVILKCYIGSLMEMNQLLLFLLIVIYI